MSSAAQALLDLTGNGVIDDGDVGGAVEAWIALRHGGRCTSEAYRFLEGAGTSCLEVADVQRLAAGWGRTPAGMRVEPVEIMDPASVAATFVVNSTGDESDAHPGDGVCETRQRKGECTLRAAIEEANARAGADSIHFDIRNPDGSCPALVRLEPANTPTRTLTLEDRTGGTTIDGYTQCGAAPNRQDRAGDAVIKIEIRGNDQDGVHGLQLKSAHNVVRGLALYNWDWQLAISGSAARYNRVQGNFLGTDAANRFRAQVEHRTWHRYGVHIRAGASYNIIGCGSYDSDNDYQPCGSAGAFNAARNIIAGNGNDGLGISDEGTNHNRVVGNYIGLRQDGRNRPNTAPNTLGNGSDGVDINGGARYNWIGGSSRPTASHPGERNILSGNYEGLEISHGSTTEDNMAVGNYVGLDAFGNATVQSANLQNGIALEDAVTDNTIRQNVIGNNGRNGIFLLNLIKEHRIESNLIGLAPDGQTAVPNGLDPTSSRHGIFAVGGSAENQIRRNTIAYQPEHGIALMGSGSDFNLISENRLFKNGLQGIALLEGANQNLPAPTLSSATNMRVKGYARLANGNACEECKVEIFIADKTGADPGGDNSGEGEHLVATGTTDDDGEFDIRISDVEVNQLLTATLTDRGGNTSPFSSNTLAGDPNRQVQLWMPFLQR